ncbi:Peptidase S74 domain-containing protein [Entamoeba marina]
MHQPTQNKKWICTFPGCQEISPKTHYNCYSHVWDAHLRHIISSPLYPKKTPSYKKLPDKKMVKGLCEKYMSLIDNNQNVLNSPPYVVQKGSSSLEEISGYENYQNFSNKQILSKHDDLKLDEFGTNNQFGNEQTQFPFNFDTLVNPIQNNDLFNTSLQQNCQFNLTLNSLQPNNFSDNLILFCSVQQLQNKVKRLYIVGDMLAENGFYQRSDERYKTDITPLKNSLTTLLQLTGVTYQYKNEFTTHYGFIAQDVASVVPELAPNGKSVDPSGFIPIIVEALKELLSICHNNTAISIEAKKALSAVNEINKTIQKTNENNCRNEENFNEEYNSQIDNKKNKKKLGFEFSLGPALITGIIGLIVTGLGIWVIFGLRELPAFWVYLWLVAFCYWASFLKSRKEFTKHLKKVKLYWNINNTTCLYIIGFIGLIVINTTLVMGVLSVETALFGCFVVVFVVVLSTLSPPRLGCTLEFVLTILIAFVIFFSMIITAFILTQPGFECQLNGNHEEYTLEVTINKTIDNQVVNWLPWNCFYYQLLIDGELPQGLHVINDKTPYITGYVSTPFNNTSVNVYLQCVGVVKFYCSSILFKSV